MEEYNKAREAHKRYEEEYRIHKSNSLKKNQSELATIDDPQHKETMLSLVQKIDQVDQKIFVLKNTKRERSYSFLFKCKSPDGDQGYEISKADFKKQLAVLKLEKKQIRAEEKANQETLKSEKKQKLRDLRKSEKCKEEDIKRQMKESQTQKKQMKCALRSLIAPTIPTQQRRYFVNRYLKLTTQLLNYF